MLYEYIINVWSYSETTESINLFVTCYVGGGYVTAKTEMKNATYMYAAHNMHTNILENNRTEPQQYEIAATITNRRRGRVRKKGSEKNDNKIPFIIQL